MGLVSQTGLLLGLATIACAARAGSPSPQPDAPLESLGVIVVSSTPLLWSDWDRDLVPEAIQILDAADLNRTGIPSLTGALLDHVPSAAINDTEGNVFQPDLLFRGFTASPVAGTPQGLAVYVNGARFNDAFGDTVNWDLISPAAIESVELEASNPVFGLNALGGSVSIRLKNGFTTQTENFTVYGGSYGRESAIFEFGKQAGPFAIYIAADATHDDGFRQTSSSDLYRLYADFGWRGAAAELHLGVTGAHDMLGNPGATPIQALAANLSDIFTAPNVVDNSYFALNLDGVRHFSDTTSVQGVAYVQQLNQVIPNGTTAEVGPCGDGTGLLCNDDGTVVTSFRGHPVGDFLDGATYSGLSVQQLDSKAYGISIQATDESRLIDAANRLVAGLSFDGSDSVFAGVAEIGGFNATTREFVGPGVVQDQPSEGVNPVRVRSGTHFYGVFLTDVVTLAPGVELNLAGRFNDALVDLEDELGGPVHGDHGFARFNPSAGLTFRLARSLQLYGSYTETNRAPTPEELSCASAAAPCSLLNFFVGDPDLKQVVAHTYEVGVRGKWAGEDRATIGWNLDAYHALNTNDIVYENTVYNPNLAYYTNAGRTLRQGIEATLRYDQARLHLSLGYAFTDATYRTALLLGSPSNPAANANGEEPVLPGDRIPGIPRHRANLTLDYTMTEHWSVGGSLAVQSNAYRFGDEANLTAPVAGYAVVDLNAAFHAGKHFTVFAVVNNVLDRRYNTYGSFGPVGDVPWPSVAGGVTDPRTASPGTPITAFGGLRLTF
jgi:outer membrane receptor protein involved in Fe transport